MKIAGKCVCVAESMSRQKLNEDDPALNDFPSFSAEIAFDHDIAIERADVVSAREILIENPSYPNNSIECDVIPYLCAG